MPVIGTRDGTGGGVRSFAHNDGNRLQDNIAWNGKSQALGISKLVGNNAQYLTAEGDDGPATISRVRGCVGLDDLTLQGGVESHRRDDTPGLW